MTQKNKIIIIFFHNKMIDIISLIKHKKMQILILFKKTKLIDLIFFLSFFHLQQVIKIVIFLSIFKNEFEIFSYRN